MFFGRVFGMEWLGVQEVHEAFSYRNKGSLVLGHLQCNAYMRILKFSKEQQEAF